MIKIETNDKEVNFEIKGSKLKLGMEITAIVRGLVQEHPEFANDIMFALLEETPREEINKMIEDFDTSSRLAQGLANKDEKSIEELVDLLISKLGLGGKKDE